MDLTRLGRLELRSSRLLSLLPLPGRPPPRPPSTCDISRVVGDFKAIAVTLGEPPRRESAFNTLTAAPRGPLGQDRRPSQLEGRTGYEFVVLAGA